MPTPIRSMARNAHSPIRRWSVAVALASVAMSSVQALQNEVWLDDNGIVAIEFESADLTGAWTVSTATPGFTGDSYIRWDGPDLFNSPGAQGLFSFDFEVETGGEWFLNLRNRHENPDPTEENDVWIRMDNDPWIKVFSNFPSSVGNWTWEARFDEGSQPAASYMLTPGVHTIEFSGRSNGFKMDRFHLFQTGASGAFSTNTPESDRRFGEPYCVAANNSTGGFSETLALGTPEVTANDITLTTSGLPNNVLGYYVVSPFEAYVVGVGGSDGNLCVGNSTGRYAGNILSSGTAGEVDLQIDVSSIPQPNGAVVGVAGETWRFQLWHRDTNGAGATSNFSRGLRVTLE